MNYRLTSGQPPNLLREALDCGYRLNSDLRLSQAGDCRRRKRSVASVTGLQLVLYSTRLNLS